MATGGGGWHDYFAVKGPVASHDLAKGLELRASGRQVVAPPSIHPETGREYVWVARAPLAPMPEWLIALTRGHRNGDRPAASRDEWVRMLHDGIPEGRRNTSLAALAGLLLRRYVPVDVTAELLHAENVARCRPPLPARNVDVIINSVAGRELRRRNRKGTK